MSAISDKPNGRIHFDSRSILRGFRNPAGILLISLMLIVAGVSINYFFGLRGTMLLTLGQGQSDVYVDHHKAGIPADRVSLDFIIRLDSLSIEPHEQLYEIQLWRQDPSYSAFLAEGETPIPRRIAVFAAEQMKINKIRGTDFRFRLKELYPNFSFSYSYPEDTDTIQPKAPGIMLELKTAEGNAVVTLRSDVPNRDKLADILNLGAELEFHWDLPKDSLAAIRSNIEGSGNKILFSGSDRMVYYLFDGNIESRQLDNTSFYEIPGKAEMGFRMLHLFPDASYLQAIPKTEGNEFLNPVAKIEIWKHGQGYQEAFLYPDLKGRRGGQFQVPGTSYALTLGISQPHELQYTRSTLTLLDPANDDIKTQTLTHRKAITYRTDPYCLSGRGHRFSQAAYDPQNPDNITIRISHQPGNAVFFCGSLLMIVAVGVMFLRKNTV
ncbi:MAG TPA: hypothetical protein VI603_05655 [Saprospiraceae bacterium]|nr:hypothetical protein [Saprospiraceae bacterium]